MYRSIFAFLLAAVFAVAISAQDYDKAEFYGGYSLVGIDNSHGRFAIIEFGSGSRKFNGFEVAGVYNFTKYIGVKADFSGAYKTSDFNVFNPPNERFIGQSKNSLYNYVVGVQFKNNGRDQRVKPFAHLMVGGAHLNSDVTGVCDPPTGCTGTFLGPLSRSGSGVSGVIGGGLDIKLSDRFDLRAVQVDWNPAHIDGTTLHNFRFGAGIVIK